MAFYYLFTKLGYEMELESLSSYEALKVYGLISSHCQAIYAKSLMQFLAAAWTWGENSMDCFPKGRENPFKEALKSSLYVY